MRGGRIAGLTLALALGAAGAPWLGCVSLKDDGLPEDDASAPFDTSAPLDTTAPLDVSAPLDGGDGTFDDDARLDGEGTPLSGPLWPNDVPVCWELVAQQVADQDAAAFSLDPQPSWIHDHVETGWGHEANLRFGTWPLCPTQGTGTFAKVVIVTPDGGDDGGESDAEAASVAVGGTITGAGTNASSTPEQPAGVTLWEAPPSVSGAEVERCAIDRIFSLLLGLADDPAAQPLGAAVCGDASNPLLDMRLSPLQILRVREAYGGKPRGSVVSFDGRCLTASSATAGAVVWTDDCTPDETGLAGVLQRWRFDPWGHSVTLSASGLALDSHGAGTLTQSIVETVVAGSPDQVWTTSVASIRGIGGTCLDFQVTPESRVVLSPCTGTDVTQQFDFGPSASIRAAGGAPDAGSTCLVESGGVVGAAPCDGSLAQSWGLATGGAIQSAAVTGGCLAAVLPDPSDPEVGLEDGLSLRVVPCTGGVEQQFDVLSVLLASPSAPTCLDVAAYTRADYTTIQTYPCEQGIAGAVGGANEWWDVTW